MIITLQKSCLGCNLPLPIEPKQFIISLSIDIITFLELAIIEKIVKAMFTPSNVRWIQGFLSNRQAKVRLNRAYSRSWVMREGIPQGSVLAPLLFLFVIDDLQDCLPRGVHSRLFADETVLWVHSPKNQGDTHILS
jgi:hypothetical protein